MRIRAHLYKWDRYNMLDRLPRESIDTRYTWKARPPPACWLRNPCIIDPRRRWRAVAPEENLADAFEGWPRNFLFRLPSLLFFSSLLFFQIPLKREDFSFHVTFLLVVLFWLSFYPNEWWRQFSVGKFSRATIIEATVMSYRL